MVARLFEKRFGPLSERANTELERRSAAQLQQLGLDLLDFVGGAELDAWLAQNPAPPPEVDALADDDDAEDAAFNDELDDDAPDGGELDEEPGDENRTRPHA